MKISFHGAARTVTGSKHLLQTDNGVRVLLDCGLFQGMGADTDMLNRHWGFEPQSINVVVLSHAHIDHAGLLPKLIKDGFRGTIWCTPATADLANIMLQDSARIQEADVRYVNKRRMKQGRSLIEALYTEEDSEEAVKHFRTLDYGSEMEIAPGIRLHFSDAGHLLGSACVHLSIDEHGNKTNLTFSGDIGRYFDTLLRAPEAFRQADYIIMESTYGNSLHALAVNIIEDLLKWIQHTCIEKGGRLIIPAFSVGRTQEVLYQLNRLELERRLPAVQYYVDSPLSVEATEVIRSHPECFNSEVEQTLRRDEDIFNFKGLHYLSDVEDSMALNENHVPCVVISASGMAEAGRVKHHIAHAISDDRNSIVLVGYCEPHSLGGRLKSGVHEVNIFGKPFEVRAEVGNLEGMSAHGDYDDLLHWLASQNPSKVKKLFLVHGEYNVQQDFARRLDAKGYGPVVIPEQHEEVVLT
jgi:metallo-beta-lactamase family protein